jgi:asparagine synthase (glutamine-hydrolysing)
MEGILPRKVQWRTDKADLSSNIVHNMWKYDAERIQEMLSSGRSELKEYVNIHAVEQMVDTCMQKPGHSRRRATSSVASVYMLWRWLEKEKNAG